MSVTRQSIDQHKAERNLREANRLRGRIPGATYRRTNPGLSVGPRPNPVVVNRARGLGYEPAPGVTEAEEMRGAVGFLARHEAETDQMAPSPAKYARLVREGRA